MIHIQYENKSTGEVFNIVNIYEDTDQRSKQINLHQYSIHNDIGDRVTDVYDLAWAKRICEGIAK